MKKIKLLVFLIISKGIILASPINKEIAKKVAISFMSSKIRTSLVVKNVVIEELNGQISFYVVNFLEGGWAMVSADNSAIPILSYNLYGEYNLKDEKPKAFINLTTSYKEQIESAKSLKSTSVEISTKWNNLLHKNKSKSSKSYIIDSTLLNVTGRGHVKWSQDKNNSGGCFPSYNAYCPTGSGGNCDCDRKPVGCGAVAMGQIMWYWQWPQSSSYRRYNWELMPDELTNYSTTLEGNEVAHLLRDCGDASNMTYLCLGSWTTVNKIEKAFKNKFNYKGVKKHVRNDWKYGSAWLDLLRSEIDNGRPVFYRGDKCDLCADKHFFVLDGYDTMDPDYFWCNFGWGYPSNSYNTSRQYLNNITPGDHEYNKNQMAIVGISPTYPEIAPGNVNVFDVPYSSVSGKKNEKAQQNIGLPANGKQIVVKNGGELTLIAGKSIILKSGFHAKIGSKFIAKINPNYTQEMDIKVSGWPNVFTPNGDGINDTLFFIVKNANSWEFSAINRYNKIVFQSAGSINGNKVCVWDGSGSHSGYVYRCIIRFKNNYGRVAENDYMVHVFGNKRSISKYDDSFFYKYSKVKDDNVNLLSLHKETSFTAVPNPCNDFINLKFSDDSSKNIKVYNFQGVLCFQASDIKSSNFRINMNGQVNGLYIISVNVDNKILTKKIILEK